MKTWLVWETDYPDEGSGEFMAWTAKGAVRAFRKTTGTRGGIFGMPPIGVVEATPEMMVARAREGS